MIGFSLDTLPPSAADPAPLDFAMRRGDLVIGELPGTPSVSQVLARNAGQRPVLLLAGEELLGARQNRILNTSAWLDSRVQTRLQVSCVEQGRWADQGKGFRSASTLYFPSGLRAHTREVGHGYNRDGKAHGDQTRVWSDVQTRLEATGARTMTHSMHTIFKETDPRTLNVYGDNLRCGGDQWGFAMLYDGRLVGLELFCSPAFCSAVFGKYLRSYALDGGLGGKRHARGFEVDDLDELLDRVREIPMAVFPSAGRGQDRRFDCALFHGSALVLDDSRLAHLSLFAAA